MYAGLVVYLCMSKPCTRCKKEKALGEFHTYKRSSAKGVKTYVRSHCKLCQNEVSLAWRKANLERSRQFNRKSKARRRTGLEHKPRQTHTERLKYTRAYINKRYREDPKFKLCQVLRKRLIGALKRNTKSASTLELLGTTVEHLRQHLEAQFLPGMNWQNHGQGEDKWQVDHMMPCASFDLTKEDQQQMCFHWTNMQPLWSKDNNAKSDKVPDNRLWVDSTTGWVYVELGS